MTEQKLKQEWMGINVWNKRYDFIEKYLTTKRLQVLFAFNCAKSPEVYNQITDPRPINTLEILDKYLDGKATIEELEKARDEAWQAYYAAAYYAANAIDAAIAKTTNVTLAHTTSTSAFTIYTTPNQKTYQAEILVKLLRPEWNFNPKWLTETTKSLATLINNEKRNDLTPILADALEDNHCNNQELLNYLRNTNNLIKGDWIIDHLTNQR